MTEGSVKEEIVLAIFDKGKLKISDDENLSDR